jgi:hypothetical protein
MIEEEVPYFRPPPLGSSPPEDFDPNFHTRLEDEEAAPDFRPTVKDIHMQ